MAGQPPTTSSNVPNLTLQGQFAAATTMARRRPQQKQQQRQQQQQQSSSSSKKNNNNHKPPLRPSTCTIKMSTDEFPFCLRLCLRLCLCQVRLDRPHQRTHGHPWLHEMQLQPTYQKQRHHLHVTVQTHVPETHPLGHTQRVRRTVLTCHNNNNFVEVKVELCAHEVTIIFHTSTLQMKCDTCIRKRRFVKLCECESASTLRITITATTV